MKWRNVLLGVFILMAIGSPDNSNVQRPSLTKASVDQNELAARLGSKSVIERGGELLWQDSFGQGLAPYEISVDAFGSKIEVDALSSPSTGYSAKLTSAINANSLVNIDKILPITNVNVIGFEIRFSMVQFVDYFYVTVQYTKNQIEYFASIRYNPTTNLLQYAVNNTTYVTFATLAPAIVGRKYYYYIKLQVDTNNNKYGNVFFNDNVYNLQSISLSSASNLFLNNLIALVGFGGNGSSQDIVNIGDWVITRNEILQ